LLAFIDVAIVAERPCEQMKLSPAEMLDYLKGRGCRIGGVTLGERGLIWYDETGTVRSDIALAMPADKIVDTSGAGDVFHGAYLYSYLAGPTENWESHSRFARAALCVQNSTLGK
jgi:sugar/nucleoside kinase (ribokinase family)